MQSYVADTVALVRYFEDKLPREANKAFLSAETDKARVLVPSIVIGEFIYSALKGHLKVPDPQLSILELLQSIEISDYLVPVDMTFAAWQQFLNLQVPELHDRMICAIAIINEAEVITNDPEIKVSGITTIW